MSREQGVQRKAAPVGAIKHAGDYPATLKRNEVGAIGRAATEWLRNRAARKAGGK